MGITESTLTDREKELVHLLALMVHQYLRDKLDGKTRDENLFNSGCIRNNRNVLMTLVEYGLMEGLYPEESEEDYPWRWFHAKFVDNWEEKLWNEPLRRPVREEDQ